MKGLGSLSKTLLKKMKTLSWGKKGVGEKSKDHEPGLPFTRRLSWGKDRRGDPRGQNWDFK